MVAKSRIPVLCGLNLPYTDWSYPAFTDGWFLGLMGV